MYYGEEIKKYDIVHCNLGFNKGSIQSNSRYCVVVSNNKANKYSPVIQIIPFTTSETKAKLPTHIYIDKPLYGLKKPSTLLGEQILSLNKIDITKKVGNITDKDLQNKIDDILRIQLAL